VTETMGKINNRTIEHLGTTDQFIIRTRRKLMAMARALEESGEVPIGVDTPEVYRQRSGEMVLPRSTDWWNGYQQKREQWEKVTVKESATTSA
jgi:LigXa C-terminal domain like